LGVLRTIIQDEYLFCHSAAKVKKSGQAGSRWMPVKPEKRRLWVTLV